MNSIRQMFHVTYCESTSKGLSPSSFWIFVKWLNNSLHLKLFWAPVLHQALCPRGPVCAHECTIGDSWVWQQLCRDEWQDSWRHGVPALVKYTSNSAGDTRDAGSILGQEDPWGWKWQPTPGLLPEESHEQRSLAGYNPWGPKESDMTEWLSTQ